MDTSTIDSAAAPAAGASTTEPEVRTFRGRSVEAILPQVRAELGPNAIVVRRREGLAGGIGGFFQRSFAEVDARAPLADEQVVGEDVLRNDRATTEGISSPAIQALVEQASPFADALARAQTPVSGTAHDLLLAAARDAIPAGLYGPQPAAPAAEEDEEPPVPARASIVAPAPAAPAPSATGAAAGLVSRLVANGLSTALATDVVDAAAAHGLPFAPRALKRTVRANLAARVIPMRPPSGEPRVIAVVGAGGAGKTSAVAAIATAYAGIGADVAVVALRTTDNGTALRVAVGPTGAYVITAATVEQARAALRHRSPLLTIVDTPAVGPAAVAEVGTLAGELGALGVGEVHLAVPATISAGAAQELWDALTPLGVSHVALTNSDQTARPGAAVELAIGVRRPLSYVSTGGAVEPADPVDLARRLLP